MNPQITSQIGEVCIPNINTKERQKRLRFGTISLIIPLPILAVLLAMDAPLWWRLLLFPMFAGSATGYFQWRDKT